MQTEREVCALLKVASPDIDVENGQVHILPRLQSSVVQTDHPPARFDRKGPGPETKVLVGNLETSRTSWRSKALGKGRVFAVPPRMGTSPA